jgi:glycosyltransferase involved in cell wall biosynthesis
MKYSIITVNFNNKEGLRKTIESVIHQTFRDFEFIIIDGGSTDGSVDVLKEYDSQINYWVSEPDGGIYNAMNKGVAHAHGDYCIFMNSGDCFYNQTVLEQVNAVNPIENIVVGKVAIDNQDNIISPPPQGVLTMYHLYSGSVPHQGSFIKTELLRKYPYDESLGFRRIGNSSFRY